MRRYREAIEAAARDNESNVVLALDLEARGGDLLPRCLAMVEATSPYVCAVKLNQVALRLGILDGTPRLVERCHDLGLPTIVDCKLSDVGHTNRALAELYFEAGFDALTANPLVGWEDGLEPVFGLAKRLAKGVLLLAYMSHRGAVEGYGRLVDDPGAGRARPQYELFAERALGWGADGVVVGATYPDKIRAVRQVVGDAVPIYSPGVAVQGGKAGEAVRAGASYIIVGRAVTGASDPAKAAMRAREEGRGER